MKTIPPQYAQLKSEANGAIVLMLLGDFYEAFDDDARLVSKLLGLVLTNTADGHAVAGFPRFHLNHYQDKLVAAGHRIALCEPTLEGRK